MEHTIGSIARCRMELVAIKTVNQFHVAEFLLGDGTEEEMIGHIGGRSCWSKHLNLQVVNTLRE